MDLAGTTEPTNVAQAQPTVEPPCRYRVGVASAAGHLFEVSLRIGAGGSTPRRLSLPAWIPGSYLIRDFARHIVAIGAETHGESVSLTKLDKQTWELAPTAGPVEVRYQVYAFDLSVRSAYLDATRAYFNGSSLLLRLHGAEGDPCELELVRPPADQGCGQGWTVETTLPAVAVDGAGFGRYAARDYWALIDHPVQCALHRAVEFEVQGVPHRAALSGRVEHCDLDRLAADLRAVCAYQARLFGALPLERYLFLLTAVGDGYGGLEHRDSCSLLCARDDLPAAGERDASEGYRKFLGLCSHEYFHLWNVKRIQPAVFSTADLAREVHTTLLWAFEGITSYYDDLALVRSGRIPVQGYLELLARSISRLFRTPGRRRQSLAESSFDAWTKFYKADENAPNAIVSYYLKGSLVAWGLGVLSVALLALGGLPPLAGFMSKWQIFVGGFQTKDGLIMALVVFAGLNSVLSLGYYAPIVNRLYRIKPAAIVENGQPVPLLMSVPLVLLCLGIVILGFWPSLVNWITVPAAQTLLLLFGG